MCILSQSQHDVKQSTIAIINGDQSMIAWAGRYIDAGYFPIPLYVPIIHEAGRTGCACENFKRSEKYRQFLEERGRGRDFDPKYRCPQPGKHPIGFDWEGNAVPKPDETEEQWRKRILNQWGWVRRTVDVETGATVRYLPNIGIAAGPSNVLALDADSYKETYAGGDLLGSEDKETITSITGSGGEHWVYDRGGADYGNDRGTLPEGVDVRGVGGQIAVEPSLHKSGRRYQWEEGYSPFDIKPQPLPESLRSILETAHENKRNRAAAGANIKFGEVGADAPDLAQWRLSPATIDKISNPAPKGQRSETDYGVVLALCGAGADDDAILAIFTHYPIGAAGKFAERGIDYLARTIANARAWLADQEAERQRTLATIEALRLWARTTSFAEFIPDELRGAVYRSDGTDTKLLDALCDGWERARKLSFEAGKKRLGKDAGLSCNTVLKGLQRLQRIADVKPGEYGMVITLRDDFRFAQIDPLITLGGGSIGINLRETNEYSPRKATDPFLTGTSRAVKERCNQASIVAGGTMKDWLATVPKGLGETVLRTLDALGRCGDMTAAELADETGKTRGAIWRACRRLELEGRIESEREHSRSPKVYSLAPDVWRKIEEDAPTMRTAGLSAERENGRLKDSQLWAIKEKANAEERGDVETAAKADRRITRLGNARLKILGKVYADRDFSQKDLARLAFDVHPPEAAQGALIAELKQWRSDGLNKRAAFDRLTMAEYSPREAWAAINSVWVCPGPVYQGAI